MTGASMGQSEEKKYRLKNGVQDDGSGDCKSKKSLKKAIIGIVIIAAIMVIFRVSFGSAILWANISEYENKKVLVTGLTKEDFYITPKELSKMKMVSVTAKGSSAKAGTVKGIGPTMETFLKKYGKTVDDFKQVKFYASDDYTTVLVKTLHEKEVILSIAKGREPLDEYQRPLRIVIPDEDSGKWIRLVTKMEFTAK